MKSTRFPYIGLAILGAIACFWVAREVVLFVAPPKLDPTWIGAWRAPSAYICISNDFLPALTYAHSEDNTRRELSGSIIRRRGNVVTVSVLLLPIHFEIKEVHATEGGDTTAVIDERSYRKVADRCEYGDQPPL